MKASPDPLLRHLSGLAPLPTSDPAGDAVLLERFVSRRDEIAFSVLADQEKLQGTWVVATTND